MRVLAWVPQELDTSPGQRFRLEQWEPYLRAEGIEITWSAYSDSALSRVMPRPGALGRKAFGVAAALGRRLREAWLARAFDLVYIFRESALLGPALAERLLAARGVPFVFDFDDAVWVRYVSPGNSYLSYLRCPGKTATLCRRARHVLAGNAYLRDYALRYNPAVSVVPTTIDTGKYLPSKRPQNPVPVIGWTGSYSTEQYLAPLKPVVERLARRRAFRLVVVGGGRFAAEGVEVEHRPWRAQTETADLADFDIGLMPLPDAAWERGKCGLKALQYMALGIPAIASPVGVNAEIVRSGHNGLLASSADEWEKGLELLMSEPGLRHSLGMAGRLTVEKSYSAAIHAARVATLLRAASA